MRILKRHTGCLLAMLVIFVGCSTAGAFEKNDCPGFINFKKDEAGLNIKTRLENFTQYSTLQNEKYIMCFDEQDPIPIKSLSTLPITINNTTQYPLLIYGLNLNTSNSNTQTLLTLSGQSLPTGQAGITLQNVTFTGTATGTAIQVNGTNITVGPDNKLTNFEKGIVVSANASANIFQTDFLSIAPEKAISFAAGNAAYLDIAWIGKHINEIDANYADRVAGKVLISEGEECAGTVEMLVREDLKANNTLSYKTAEISRLTGEKATGLKLKDDPADKPSRIIIPKGACLDETGKPIATEDGKMKMGCDYPGDCHFDMKDLKIVIEYIYIGFTFTNSSGHTIQYLPAQALVKDLPDVINVPGLPIYMPTTSGIDGTDTGGNTVIIPAYQPPETPQGADKTDDNELYVSTTDDQKKESKDQTIGDEKVDQGSSGAGAGCGGQQSITPRQERGYSNIMWSLIALGGLPLFVMCRRFFASPRLSTSSRLRPRSE